MLLVLMALIVSLETHASTAVQHINDFVLYFMSVF